MASMSLSIELLLDKVLLIIEIIALKKKSPILTDKKKLMP